MVKNDWWIPWWNPLKKRTKVETNNTEYWPIHNQKYPRLEAGFPTHQRYLIFWVAKAVLITDVIPLIPLKITPSWWTWICLFDAWNLEKYSQMVVWGWFTMVESFKKKLKQIQVEEIQKAVAIYDTLWQKLGTTLQRLQCGRKDFLSQSAVSLLCQWAQHVFRPGTLMTLLVTPIFFDGQGPPIFVSTHALVLIMSEWVHLPWFSGWTSQTNIKPTTVKLRKPSLPFGLCSQKMLRKHW